MKRAGVLQVALIAVLVGLLVFFAGCGGSGGDSSGTGTPKEAVQAYVDALKNNDAAALYALFSKADREMISEEQLKESMGSEGPVDMSGIEVKIGKETIEGDTAKVEVTTSLEGQEYTETMALVKEDGEWKLDFTSSVEDALPEETEPEQ